MNYGLGANFPFEMEECEKFLIQKLATFACYLIKKWKLADNGNFLTTSGGKKLLSYDLYLTKKYGLVSHIFTWKDVEILSVQVFHP